MRTSQRNVGSAGPTNAVSMQPLSASGRSPSQPSAMAVLRDGDFALWESMAINLYLAKKCGRELYPGTLEGEASAWQWSFWAVASLERPLMTVQVAAQRFPPGGDMERYYRRHLLPWDADEV